MHVVLSQIKKFLPRRAKPRGAALILIVFFFIAITLAVIQGATIRSVLDLRNARTSSHSNAAFYATEAGLEDAYYRTATGKNVPDTVTIDLDSASATVRKIVSGAENQYFAFGQSPTGEVRKGHLALNDGRISLPFFYGVIAGDGGLAIGDNTIIKGKGSRLADVYSNGPVTGTINSQIYGNVTSAYGTVFGPEITQCDVYETNLGGTMAQAFIYEGAQSVPLTSVSLMLREFASSTSIYSPYFVPATVKIIAYPYPLPLTSNGYSDGYLPTPPVTNSLAEENVDPSVIPINYYNDLSFGTSSTWNTIPLKNPVILEPGHAYGILVSIPFAGQLAEEGSWCGAYIGDSYRGRYNGSFSNTAHDFVFAKYLNWNSFTQTYTWSAWGGTMGVKFQTFKLGLGDPVANSLLGDSLSGLVVKGVAKGASIANSVIKGDAYFQKIAADSSVLGVRHLATTTPPRIDFPMGGAEGVEQLANYYLHLLPSYFADPTNNPYAFFTNTQVGTASTGAPIMGNAFGPGIINAFVNPPQTTLTLSNGTYYITGTIIVNGNLNVGPHARLQCAPSMGSNSCMIIVAGLIDAHDQATFAGSGARGSFLYAISIDRFCNGVPGPLVFYANETCLPNNSSIHLTDNVTGAIFYAPYGGIDLSNNVYANSVIGYKIIAHDNVTIEYDPLESLIVVAPSVNHANSGWNPTRWSEY
jgi:hypothetical protein